jgi:subtilisin family serine protease
MKTNRLFGVLAVVAAASAAHAGDFRRNSDPVPGRYIVVFKDGAVSAAGLSAARAADDHARAYGVRRAHVFSSAIQGYSAIGMTEAQARTIASDPSVAFVEEDGYVHATVTQTGATWGLDRIDQHDLPLSMTYTYNFNGAGVHAYIVDTGIRATHTQFTGRMGNGFTSVNDGNGTNDCNGHGTHVSGTVGGTTWGVAKGVTLHAVRVLDCGGSGTNAGVIAGIDWVRANHIKPAVANMSLGGGASSALDAALNNAIAAGVTFAVAAGNENANACNGSPSRVAAAITVGASTIADARASFSNFGTCVDIFAPGLSITSSWNASDTATNTISGTSMATPHVTGVVALYLSQFGAQAPSTVAAALNTAASLNKLSGIGTGSPNRLLFSMFGGSPVTPTPTPTPTMPTATPTRTPTPPAGSELPVVAVTASTNDGNVPGNAIDNNLNTRWSGMGNGAWIKFDLGGTRVLSAVGIAFYKGNVRTSPFELQISSDNVNWTTFGGTRTSSGTTLAEQRFNTAGATGRWVRYLGHGNSEGSGWNSLTEVNIYAP